MAQRKKPNNQPRQQRPATPASPQPAATIAPETSLLTTYLKPFILFILAAAVILYMIAQLGNRDSDFPAENSVEAGFTRDMITHHAQAVQTAMILRDRLPDDAPIELDQFLWDIISTQQNQIGQMEAWLNVWGLPQGSAQPPMAWMGHEVTGLMPGMMTDAQIEELRTLPYPQAVNRFMELMIVHHVAAVDMAEAVIDETDNEVVTRLAEAMMRTQQGEIDVMNGWIEKINSGTLGELPAVEATPMASPEATPSHEH
jgi:uncharacterized protein (DUF305 family)